MQVTDKLFAQFMVFKEDTSKGMSQNFKTKKYIYMH